MKRKKLTNCYLCGEPGATCGAEVGVIAVTVCANLDSCHRRCSRNARSLARIEPAARALLAKCADADEAHEIDDEILALQRALGRSA